MTIDGALTQLITGNAGVAQVMADRIYPKKFPENPTYPAIVYHRISTVREYSQDGFSALTSVRFQFDVHARTYVAARDLSGKLRLAIDAFRGVVGDVDINGIWNEDEDDGYDDDLNVFWFRQDYRVLHNE